VQNRSNSFEIHYAIKALFHPAALAALAELGSFFDVSTSGELTLLRELNIAGNRIIHTHPLKRDRDIRDPIAFGCETFVADNAEELTKLVPYRDQISVLSRVGFRDKDAVVDRARKFGCAPDTALDLSEEGRRLGLRISRLSIHARR